MGNMVYAGPPNSFEALLNKFPQEYRKAVEILDKSQLRVLEEIRFKAEERIIFVGGFGEIESEIRVSIKGIAGVFERLLDYSVYAHMEDLCRGFVTAEGGHRIGICGKAVVEAGRVKTIKEVSSINVRKSSAIEGCSAPLLKHVFTNEGRFLNTLIVSPPKCGKTTLLRDLILELSKRKIRVSLVDERSEIAAVYKGVPQHNVGSHCDVLDSCGKAEGIILMLRSMSPSVICTDEIGSLEDAGAIGEAITSGVGVLTSVHGNDFEELKRSKIGSLLENRVFDRYVFMKAVPRVGTIAKILDGEGKRIDI